MAVENVLIASWLYKTFSTDTQMQAFISSRIYEDNAPQLAVFPHILFHCSYWHDVLNENGVRLMTTANYYVTVYDKTSSYASLAPIDARMDTLIHRLGIPRGTAPGTVAITIPNTSLSGTIQNCIRLEPFQMAITQRGTDYRRLGGKYYFEVIAD